jgi:5-methylcytosine-specific restriction endonuclease McrA
MSSFFAFVLVFGYPAYRIIRYALMKRYFGSEEFQKQKKEVAEVVREHNEIASYVEEIRSHGKFSIGQSSTGTQAHLASYENTSTYKYKRDRNTADYDSSNVHNASLQVVRNASVEPIKYLIKYFDIAATEEKLAEIESMGESISRLEEAISNLEARESSISTSINPPKFILKHYLNEFRAQVGLNVPQLKVPYPEYKFQYVSAGGNSSQQAVIKMDSPTIDALIQSIAEKIKWSKSAAAQRSLMTASLRNFIKQRDNFTCKTCQISTRDEAHLLLEVDHIQPISKGGLSEESNLQTLCWKCNRTKSNKY